MAIFVYPYVLTWYVYKCVTKLMTNMKLHNYIHSIALHCNLKLFCKSLSHQINFYCCNKICSYKIKRNVPNIFDITPFISNWAWIFSRKNFRVCRLFTLDHCQTCILLNPKYTLFSNNGTRIFLKSPLKPLIF